MSNERIAKALGALALTTVSDLSPAKIKVYIDSLNCYTVDQIERAAKALATQPGRIHFPTVGEFCALIEGTATTQAEIKWQRLHMAIGRIDAQSGERIGRDNPPTVDGATAAALRSIGGFKVICDSPEDYASRQWLRKHFIEAFEAYSENQVSQDVVQIGRDEATRFLQSAELRLTGGSA